LADVYSTRFMAWSSSESPTPFEVPAGKVCVVRDADIYSGGGAIINWQLEILDGAKFAAGQFTVESLAQTAQWRGRQILFAGEFLVFGSDGATDGAVSGYLLTAP
jgi:hypothetical protein